MDLVPIKGFLDAAIEIRRAFPESGDVLKQALGTYVTDPLKDRRDRRRIDRVAKLADEKIGDRKKEENLEEVMTSTEVEPLLEAIQDDDRKELQEIWANMLAKFATGQSQGFRREFIVTLKKLEPIDVKCLQLLPTIFSNGYIKRHIIIDLLHDRLGIDRDELSISVDNLRYNKCLMPSSSNNEDYSWCLSSYGKILSQAAFAPA